jgi:small subunit ribosomal protein S4
MINFSKPKIKILKKLDLLNKEAIKTNTNKLNYKEKETFLNTDKNTRSSISNDYKERLIEKQKLRTYFCFSEKQLYNYVKKIKRKKYFNKFSLIELINSRLDSIVFNLGFSKSISEAKQFINHGHILLNNKIVNFSNIICKHNDLISIKKDSNIINLVNINLKFNNKFYKKNLELDFKNLVGKFINPIKSKDLFIKFNESKIIEYYSNK